VPRSFKNLERKSAITRNARNRAETTKTPKAKVEFDTKFSKQSFAK
jgi:hypothetical protein